MLASRIGVNACRAKTARHSNRLRAEHECINAHARRMGLRQLSLRGKLKARIHLLWFAVAHNMMRFLALHARALLAA